MCNRPLVEGTAAPTLHSHTAVPWTLGQAHMYMCNRPSVEGTAAPTLHSHSAVPWTLGQAHISGQ